jgi:predicted SAM-dependent methyltransferase
VLKSVFRSLLPASIRKFLATVPYWGIRYRCNCCNLSFRRFLAFGHVPRLNARCPYCDSLERQRLLWFYLKRECLSEGLMRVLHFAPEPCLSRNVSRLRNIRYFDADLNPAIAKHVMDITRIPFRDKSFDLIICSHVLGHVPDDAKAISELVRVLRNRGIALIMAVLDFNNPTTIEDPSITTPADRLRHYGEPDLCRLYGRDFAQRLERGGFRVHTIDYRQVLGQRITSKYCLGNGDRELLFRCHKT